MFGWFDVSKVDEFAREISEEFAHHWPLHGALADKGAEQKLAHAIGILGNRAAKFNRQERLGWYRKARFLRTIKDELQARGGAEALVDRIVYDVVLKMAQPEAPRG